MSEINKQDILLNLERELIKEQKITQILNKLELELRKYSSSELNMIGDDFYEEFSNLLESEACYFESSLREAVWPIYEDVLQIFKDQLNLDLTISDLENASLDFWRNIYKLCKNKGCGGYDYLLTTLENRQKEIMNKYCGENK